MATKTYWIEEPLIMAAEYDGHVTNADIDQVMAECVAAVDKQPCYFLVDTLKMASIQPSFLKVGSLLKFINHPNLRWLAMVIDYNPMIKFAMQVLVRKNASVFKTRDEALTFLRNRIEVDKAAQEVANRLPT